MYHPDLTVSNFMENSISLMYHPDLTVSNFMENSISIMYHPDLTVSNFMENSISLKRIVLLSDRNKSYVVTGSESSTTFGV